MLMVRRPDLRPGAAIGGLEGCERAAAAHQLDPVGGGDRRACGMGGAASSRRPALERDPVARRYHHHGMAGVGVQALANHHSGLGPDLVLVRLATRATMVPLPFSG